MRKKDWIKHAQLELGSLCDGIDLAEAWERFKGHRKSSGKRLDANGDPILMKMTFVEWCRIWFESGHWHERRRGGYCMARRNDLGHYEVGNVVITTSAENTCESWTLTRGKRLQKMCVNNPNRIPVIFQGVEYPSIAAASKATGVHRFHIYKSL